MTDAQKGMNRPQDVIGTVPCPSCALCGDGGRLLYGGLQDRLFGTAGEWRLKQCTNARCGLVWLDPMPSKDEVWKAYRRYYTHTDTDSRTPRPGLLVQLHRAARDGYFEIRYGYPTSVRRRMLGPLIYLYPAARLHADFAVSYQPRRSPPGRFLEVGFGRGDILERMVRLGWDAHGVDVDPTSVASARARGLNVRLGTLQEAAFPDDWFDAISLNHVIEHVHDPIELLIECRRVLKHGGQLVLTTPNMESLGHHIFASKWLHLDAPRHLQLFNLRLLRSMAQRCGLDIRILKTSARGADTSYRASRSIQRLGRVDPLQRAGLAERIRMKFFYLLESLMTWRGRAAGEEVLLIATKSAGTP